MHVILQAKAKKQQPLFSILLNLTELSLRCQIYLDLPKYRLCCFHTHASFGRQMWLSETIQCCCKHCACALWRRRLWKLHGRKMAGSNVLIQQSEKGNGRVPLDKGTGLHQPRQSLSHATQDPVSFSCRMRTARSCWGSLMGGLRDR